MNTWPEITDSRTITKEFVTIGDASEILGVSIDTIRRWEKIGKLHSQRLDGKNRYFDVEELHQFLSVQPLSTTEVAVALGVSPSTVRRLEQQGLLLPGRDKNGRRLYTREIVNDYINQLSEQKLTHESTVVPPEYRQIANVSYVSTEPSPSISSQPPVPHNVRQPINKRLPNIKDLIGNKLPQQIPHGVRYAGGGLLGLVAIFAVLFLMFPTGMNENFGYANASDDNAEGHTAVYLIPLRPFAQAGRTVAGILDKDATTIQVGSLKNAFQADENGNITADTPITVPDTSYIKIPDKNQINNLNSEYVGGFKPGSQEGNLAVLPITGDKIKDKSINGVDVADGTIQLTNLSPALQALINGRSTGVGTAGATGAQGPAGPTGPQGPAGPQGPSGGGVANVTAGAGLLGGGSSASVTLQVDTGNSTEVSGSGLEVRLASSNTTSTTFSSSGLEVTSQGLRLLGGCASGQILKWNGTAWACGADDSGGSSSFTIQSSDGGIVANGISTIQFGPPSNSSDEFAVTNLGSGQVRIELGTNVLLSTNFAATLDPIYANASETPAAGDISGSFDGGFFIGNDAVALGTETTGNFVASVGGSTGLSVSGSGSENASVSIGLDVVTTGSTSTLSSNSGLELGPDGLRLVGGCSNGEVLKWSTSTSAWVCSTDANAGSMAAQEEDATVSNAVSTLDFLGADFNVTETPAGEVNIAIDYTSSGITRTTQSAVITGNWLFTDNAFSIRDNTDNSKQVAFQISGVSPSTTRTLLVPNNDGTIITTGNLSDITSLGTITTGTWQGAVIGSQYGGTGVNGSVAANGTLLIGNGSGYSLTTLTQGSGISISNGAGSITVAAALGTSISGSEIDLDAVTLGSQTVGNYVQSVTAGNGLTGDIASEGGVASLAVGGGNGISVSADSIAVSVQANKGLEVDGSGLSLIDCITGEILKYNGSNQWICAADNGTGTVPTLQDVYGNDIDGSNAVINLTSADGGIRIRDNSTPLGTNLLSIQNDDGSTTYFGVNNTGITTNGTVNGASISGGTLSGGSLSASAVNGLSVSGGTITVGTWNGTALTDAYISDTLTASIFVGSGSTTNAIDLGTAEVSGVLGDSNVSDTLTSSIFIGSGSTTNAIDLATAEVSGNLWATSLQNAGANLGAANVNIDFSNTNGSFVTNLTIDGALTASSIIGALTGNASTATALAANPTDCSANQFATAIAANGDLSCTSLTDADIPNSITVDLAAAATVLAANPTDCSANQFASAIAANGNLSCASITDADVADTLTASLFVGSGSTTTAIDLATAEVAGNLRANNLQSAGTDLGAANVNVDLSNTNGAFVTNFTVDGTITADTFSGTLSGNASTATALAANPTDCSANQFANAIVANGNLTCASITDADIPNNVTIDLATAATALQSNPTDCAANQFATAIAANGNLTCAALADGDIPDSITVTLAATATALAANPTDCSANQFANAIVANGNLTCAIITDADVSDTLTSSIFIGSGSTTNAIDLATAETAGILGVSNGGTGLSGASAANGQLLIGNGSGYSLAALGQGNGITITNGSGTISVAAAVQASKGLEVDGNGLSLIDCSTGEVLKYNGSNQWACGVDNGTGSAPTMDETYGNDPNGSNVAINLTSADGALIIRDNVTPLGTTLFAVQNSAGGTSYLDVTTSGITASGTINGLTVSSGTITGGTWNGTALSDAYVSDTLTASIFVGSGSTTNAIDLATAEVAGGLRATNLQGAAADLGAANVNIDLSNTNGSFVTNLTVDGTITAANFIGTLTGSASTASALAANPLDCSANQFANAIAANGDLSCAALTDADIPNSITIDLAAAATSLAANPTDCSANQFANAIAVNGNLTCASITDADVADTLTASLFVGSGSTTNAIDLATAEVAGNLRATNLQSAATDLGAINVNIDLSNTNGAFVTNLSVDGTITAATFVGALTGNASTATALASNPSDCSANQFANAIAASGNLTCASITDADVSDTLTASIFAGSGSTTNAVDLATAEVAGNLRANSLQSTATDLGAADVNIILTNSNASFVTNLTLDGTITAATFVGALTGNASTATSLAANPTDCSANQFATAIAANGNLTCATLTDADIPNTITIDNATNATNATNLTGSGSTTNAVDLATAEVAGSLRAVNLQSAGADLGAANVNIDLSNTNGAFVTNLTVDGTVAAATFVGALTGNASTATALAANPSDCSANQFANAIAASGNLTCAGIVDADVSDTLTASLFVGSGSTTTAIDLATAEVAGNLRASNLQGAAADLGAADVNIVLSNTNGAFVTNLTLDGTITAATFVGALTGNASTATALASNPSDCSANQFANTIAANGNLTCAAITDADVPNNITIDLATLATTATNLVGSGSTTGAVDLATAEVAGNLRATNLQSAAADLGAADVTINLSNTNGSFNTNLTLDGIITATTFSGALTGNASSATALAANPTDCAANQFANVIASNGNLTCASITDADVPNNITIDLATLATTANALTTNPSDCAANQFANAIAANGNLTCASITDADVSDTLTASLFVGSGSTTTAIDLATAEVAGNLRATNLQGAGTDLGAANVNIDLSNTNGGGFVTNLTVDGTITANAFSGNLTGNVTGNASTATALASNPSDCSANQFATTIAANGNLTCASIAANNLPTAAADLGAADVNLNFGNTNGSFNTNLTLDGVITATTFSGALTGNASTATALAANPTDCAANQFANTIAASGNLGCVSITDADVPNSITIDLATAATALQSNPTDCAANQFATTIAASGNLTCVAITDADVPDSITVTLAATATALAANPSDCAANSFATTIAASGNLTCASIAANNLPSAAADLGAANVTIDLSNTNGGFVTNLTVDGTINAASFVGALTGNASTATALAANPTDCAANQFATTIAANGNLTCAAITDADVSDTLTASLFVGSGSTTTAIDLATAEVAGNLRGTNLQGTAADLGAANVNIDFSNTNGAFVTNLTVDGTIGTAAVTAFTGAGATFSGVLAANNSITSTQATLVINASGTVDVQDTLNVNNLTTDTGGVSVAAGQSYTGAGAVTVSSAAATTLTLDSGTTGSILIGTDASAETISLGSGNAIKTIELGLGSSGNTIRLGTNNTTADTIQIGSALDTLTFTANASSTWVVNALTVDATEFGRLDGKNAALVDQNDFTSADGVGVTSSGSGFEAGTGGIGLLQGCGDGQILKWTDGTAIWACANDATGLSDIRLKKDVATMGSDVLDKMKGIRVVDFNFDCNAEYFAQGFYCDQNDQTGVIAQELEQVFPELVYIAEDGYRRVRYDALNMYTIKAVQELTGMVDELMALENRIETLEQKVAALEATAGVSGLSVEEVEALIAEQLESSMQSFTHGTLTVAGSAEFRGDTFFQGLVMFGGTVAFNGEVSLNNKVNFTNNTGGYAVINELEQIVHVSFATPYDQPPVISLTLGNGKFAQYSYKNVTVNGFDIVLNAPAAEALNFSWIALSVNNPNISMQP